MSRTTPPVAASHENFARFEACLPIVENAAYVSPSACILTFYRDTIVEAYAYSKTAPEELIRRINASRDKKRVPEEMRDKGDYSVTRRPLMPYFSPENLESELVRDEKTLLENAGYDLKEGFYFPFPVPSAQSPSGILFVFARDSNEAKRIEGARHKIAEDLQKLFL